MFASLGHYEGESRGGNWAQEWNADNAGTFLWSTPDFPKSLSRLSSKLDQARPPAPPIRYYFAAQDRTTESGRKGGRGSSRGGRPESRPKVSGWRREGGEGRTRLPRCGLSRLPNLASREDPGSECDAEAQCLAQNEITPKKSKRREELPADVKAQKKRTRRN